MPLRLLQPQLVPSGHAGQNSPASSVTRQGAGDTAVTNPLLGLAAVTATRAGLERNKIQPKAAASDELSWML